MAELQVMKEATQKDIDDQRVEYEERLAELAREMVGTYKHMSTHVP